MEENSPDAEPLLAASLGIIPGEIKEEDNQVLNPLDMDVDDDDLLVSVQRETCSNVQLADPQAEEADEEAITLTEFHLPPPTAPEPAERDGIVDGAIERIWQSGDKLAALPDFELGDGVKLAVQPKELWMLLMARLATRGVETKRKTIISFVTADFAARSKFASIWLNEEWYNDKLGLTSRYPTNLDAVLSAYLPGIDSKDRSLSPFLSALPEIPLSVITSLTALCEDNERSIVGFLALRDLIESRPPVRPLALQTLLELCTHHDRKTRVTAIRTVIRWVSDSPMANTVISYALAVLRRLVPVDTRPVDVEMELEDGEQTEETVQSRFLQPVQPDTVQQYVELAFALSRRQQDLLEDIFRLYPKLEVPIAESIESLLTPLIQSLGASPRLLDVLQQFPPGADKLALRVVTILSAEGANTVLVNLVKGLMGERELDPRFIVPIIGELDKVSLRCHVRLNPDPCRPRLKGKYHGSSPFWDLQIHGIWFGLRLQPHCKR